MRGPPALHGDLCAHSRRRWEPTSPDLLIIDDMGMKQLPKRSGEYLFEIIMRRYKTRSTMMTSNRPLEDWGKLLGDVPTATAILDRFLHHAEVVSDERAELPPEGPAGCVGGRTAGFKTSQSTPGSEGGRSDPKPGNDPPAPRAPEEDVRASPGERRTP